MPFYHGKEATEAIIPLLGKHYHVDKVGSLWPALWESFTQCQYVEPDNPNAPKEDQTLWYKPGRSPPPVFTMKQGEARVSPP
jgi:hypothetical protein